LEGQRVLIGKSKKAVKLRMIGKKGKIGSGPKAGLGGSQLREASGGSGGERFKKRESKVTERELGERRIE